MTRKKSFKDQSAMLTFYKRIIVLIIILCSFAGLAYADTTGFKIILQPIAGVLMTDSIQHAIDKCDMNGGGTVVFTQGTYQSGSIQLKSNITLQLESGALLKGSDKYSDYRKDAFLFGKDQTDITIEGQGIIDGVDCYNPDGEEGFRGPHSIRLVNCTNIIIKGITIQNSANYAIYCWHCSKGEVENVSIRGGHDGLHTRFCENFSISGCDFRTGDDAFAGNDNRDFTVTGCRVNSSCNGFRMGCMNFTVKQCRIWGPGEYIHKVQKRNNMLTAFVHFSPKDDNSKLKSGNWLIQDVIIENVDQVYNYNFKKGKWQTGQPVTDLTFENVKAMGILKAFAITGNSQRSLNLKITNSTFACREGTYEELKIYEGVKSGNSSFFEAENFGTIRLYKVNFTKTTSEPILNFKNGNSIDLNQVIFNTGNNSIPYTLKKITDIKKKDLKLDTSEISENQKPKALINSEIKQKSYSLLLTSD